MKRILNNKSILYLPLTIILCLIFSCNKTDKKDNNLPETTVKSGVSTDTSKKITEPLKDTLTAKTNKTSADSLSALMEKKKKKDSLKSIKENELTIKAYYFHPTARCVTCRNIESYSYEAIQQWGEKNNKSIAWAELNIEDSLNEHYKDEFGLQFSSLVIVQYVGGEKAKWKNLDDTWKLVNDKPQFIKYVTKELDNFNKKEQ